MLTEKKSASEIAKSSNSRFDEEPNGVQVIESRDHLTASYGPWTLAAGSWAFAATALIIAIFGRGAPVGIWGTICISLCLCIVTACLAEFGSTYPSADGCTHIAYKVAGPKWCRFCVCCQTAPRYTFSLIYSRLLGI